MIEHELEEQNFEFGIRKGKPFGRLKIKYCNKESFSTNVKTHTYIIKVRTIILTLGKKETLFSKVSISF